MMCVCVSFASLLLINIICIVFRIATQKGYEKIEDSVHVVDSSILRWKSTSRDQSYETKNRNSFRRTVPEVMTAD